MKKLAFIKLSFFFLFPLQSEEVKLLFGGDLMFDWGIRKVIEKYSYEKPFIGLKPAFELADFRIVNLETPIIKKKNYNGKKTYIFTAYKEDINVLKLLNIDLVSLGNNHALDHGYKGMQQTLYFLKKNKIHFVGDPKTFPKVFQPFPFKKSNHKFHFYSVAQFGKDVIFANRKRKGLASLHLPYLKKIARRNKQKKIISILLIHWGIEYSPFPSESQMKVGKILIDSGFDAIIGHHPHIPQGIEKYKNGIIAYSLGNFIFGSKNPYLNHNILVSLIYKNQKIQRVEIQGIFGKFQKKEHIQRLLNPMESIEFLKEYQFLCKKLNTKLEIVNSLGVIKM